MKFDLKHMVGAVAVWLAAAVVALAQGDQVSMRLDLVGWGDEISGLALRTPGNTPFTAHAFRYGKPQAYTGPAVLEIYQASGESVPAVAPVAADESAKLPAVLKQVLERRKNSPGLVALVPLPAGSKRATVLLMPAPGGTFLAYVMDDDPTKLPVGRLRVHNLSPHLLAIRIGGKDSHQIPQHGSCTVAPSGQELVYELAYQLDDEWKDLENNLLAVAEDEQTQMVVLKSDSEYFSSSNGSRSGFLQIVTLRRSPRETETIELSKAEKEAAAREAKRLNDEMDEAAKPDSERKRKSAEKEK